ncbi:uncharacterized protein LOC111718152 [Eurytemora carolleeae]|uniref:uncharacterized protein LOC111718152 n=1 Tax=Eurytemora carolleeae TaxID=1294199 RepID=UPI000C760A2F|nr:uncharacterized protein LOC111718152 [Eurytemora carolleeae]|eukprot:XP_023349433.1 uncharacterized protein LOC111718152 [Eurytemora affinis]
MALVNKAVIGHSPRAAHQLYWSCSCLRTGWCHRIDEWFEVVLYLLADYLPVRDELTSLLPNLYGIRREFFATSLYSLFLQQNTLPKNLSYIYREMSEYVLVKLKAKF